MMPAGVSGGVRNFPTVELTLPTGELKYGFSDTTNAKNLRNNSVLSSDRGYSSDGGLPSDEGLPNDPKVTVCKCFGAFSICNKIVIPREILGSLLYLIPIPEL